MRHALSAAAWFSWEMPRPRHVGIACSCNARSPSWTADGRRLYSCDLRPRTNDHGKMRDAISATATLALTSHAGDSPAFARRYLAMQGVRNQGCFLSVLKLPQQMSKFVSEPNASRQYHSSHPGPALLGSPTSSARPRTCPCSLDVVRTSRS